MAPYNPPNAHYAHINVDNIDSYIIWGIIGTDKKGFYKLTKELNLRYIWYDESNRRIELWGSYDAFLNGAVSKLTSLINST